jgi:hypothetical protein
MRLGIYIYIYIYITTLKAYINLFRGHVNLLTAIM